ncbi:DUF6233 domain-containing protein [Streptomyces sp. cg40]|uniref:DUF6233 domain-containing protein n=1 Tax=Streptomyces sp. cg40 TaxID=3419764 RepID=UPI003D01E6AA
MSRCPTPRSLDSVDSTECGCGTRCGWSASTAGSPTSESGRPKRNAGAATGPGPPDWVVKLSRARGEPLQVHDGECGMKRKRQPAVNRGEARRLLTADAVPACLFCHPDTQLRIIGGLDNVLIGCRSSLWACT